MITQENIAHTHEKLVQIMNETNEDNEMSQYFKYISELHSFIAKCKNEERTEEHSNEESLYYESLVKVKLSEMNEYMREIHA